MRVIAGELRGRTLKTLKGAATRPTTDRVKEALMSKVISARGSFEDCSVLDAYAGTGALGIEALSRGAAHVVFCDTAHEANKVIAENLSALGIDPSRYTVMKTDASVLSSSIVKHPVDLVFLDPPYAFSPHDIVMMVKGYFDKGLLEPDALICYELAKTSKPELVRVLNALEWAIVSSKEYGETSIVLIRKDAQ